jgi:hypothetical protein
LATGSKGHRGGELYFEFVTLGSSVKATVLDAMTGVEASIVAPASTPRSALEQFALRKLDYILNRKRDEN